MLVTLVAIAFSTTLLTLLCLGDPKRRRSAQVAGGGDGTAKRRLLATALCLPGVGFLLSGDGAAFMIWLGGSAVAGWALTLCFSQWHNRTSNGL